MANVIQLSDTLIRQIAAGEVIAEPVSVVKEAIENSIDAGATEIQVDITNGGISTIIVSDNGKGITLEDLKVITGRHCTSKIKTEEDLSKILTLGFRGEFLASLLAAADLTIITKEKNSDKAYKAVYTVGKEPQIEQTSRTTGTTLLVNNLFDKIPARRSFLPKAQTSAARIFETLRQFSLAYEKIRFVFKSDTVEKFRSQPGSTLNAVTMIFGAGTAKNLLMVQGKTTDGQWNVTGYVSTPGEVRATRASQYFFINGRIVENTILSKALADGYDNFVAPRKYPIAVLYLRGPPEDYDANVHPTKKEIRFKSEKHIYSLVQQSVYETLTKVVGSEALTGGKNQAYTKGNLVPYTTAKQDQEQQAINDREGTKKEQEKQEEQITSTKSEKEQIDDFDEEEQVPGIQENHPLEDTLQSFYNLQQGKKGNALFHHVVNKEEIKDLKPIFQLNKTFILAVHTYNTEDVYILDQHAVAERITLEKMVYAHTKIVKQTLLDPLVLVLTPDEERILTEISPIIQKHGYTIEQKGNLQVLVHALPLYQSRKLPKEELLYNIREILADSLKVKTEKGSISGAEQEIIKSIACHNSIRAGEVLSQQDMKDLLREMVEAKFPYVCCHGRPSIFRLSTKKLNQLFWRM